MTLDELRAILLGPQSPPPGPPEAQPDVNPQGMPIYRAQATALAPTQAPEEVARAGLLKSIGGNIDRMFAGGLSALRNARGLTRWSQPSADAAYRNVMASRGQPVAYAPDTSLRDRIDGLIRSGAMKMGADPRGADFASSLLGSLIPTSGDEALAMGVPAGPIKGVAGPIEQAAAEAAGKLVAPAELVKPAESVISAPRAVVGASPEDVGRLLRGESLRGTSENLVGAFAPTKPAVRGSTSADLQAMQRTDLTPKELEKLENLKQLYPDFARYTSFMTPQEISKTIAQGPNVEKFNRLLEALPNERRLSALIKAGDPKRGWYQASSRAIVDVFGHEDAPRFSALLAALSPQTSVEMNLMNTLNTWKNWTAAGRPTDPAAIRAIMGRSVAGTKGEKSVLEAWAQNAERALGTADPRKVTLSGPKVDSFFRNLADDVHRVTNDAWIAAGYGVDQGLFSGSASAEQLLRGDPGMSPGYAATSALTRKAGQLSAVHPREAQESIWSALMPMYEEAKKRGISAQELLQRGLFTPELVRGTPDFSTLLNMGVNKRILQEAGYGSQLEGLKPYQWPDRPMNLTSAEQRHLEDTADVLDRLRAKREMESRSASVKVTGTRPSRAYVYGTAEQIPGRGSGLMEGMIEAPHGTKQHFSSEVAGAFKDVRGHDLLHQPLDLPTLQTRSATGAWRPEGEIQGVPGSRKPLEINPAIAAGAEVPVTKGGKLDIPLDVKQRFNLSEFWRALLTGQDAGAWSGMIPNEKGLSMFIPGARKANREAMGLGRALTDERVYLADTGGGINVINPGEALSKHQAEYVRDLLWNPKKGSKAKPSFVPAEAVANYLPIDWSAPSGTNAQEALNMINARPPMQRRAFDQNIRSVARDLFDTYSQKAKGKGGLPFPEKMQNLLTSLRDGGLDGLDKAIKAGVVLPAGLLAALGLSQSEDRAAARH